MIISNSQVEEFANFRSSASLDRNSSSVHQHFGGLMIRELSIDPDNKSLREITATMADRVKGKRTSTKLSRVRCKKIGSTVFEMKI